MNFPEPTIDRLRRYFEDHVWRYDMESAAAHDCSVNKTFLDMLVEQYIEASQLTTTNPQKGGQAKN